MDYSELHFSIKDVKGDSGKSVARLAPIGWTCIGNNYSNYEMHEIWKVLLANKTEELIKEQANY